MNESVSGAAGSSAAVFIVIGLVILFATIYGRRRRWTRVTPEPVREQWTERNEMLEARQSADRILVELVETSREISAQMDTKIRVLNTLIRQAERLIARLEELQHLPAVSPAEPPSAPPQNASAERSRPDPAVTPHRDAGHATATKPESQEPHRPFPEEEGRGEAKEEGRDRFLAAASPSAARPSEPAALPGGREPEESFESDAQKRVVAMHARGFAIPEIAREVGLSRQEVSLILHLRGLAEG